MCNFFSRFFSFSCCCFCPRTMIETSCCSWRTNCIESIMKKKEKKKKSKLSQCVSSFARFLSLSRHANEERKKSGVQIKNSLIHTLNCHLYLFLSHRLFSVACVCHSLPRIDPLLYTLFLPINWSIFFRSLINLESCYNYYCFSSPKQQNSLKQAYNREWAKRCWRLMRFNKIYWDQNKK